MPEGQPKKKKLKDQTIQDWLACDTCNSWVAAEFSAVNSPEKKKFKCYTCNTIQELTKQVTMLNSELSLLKEELKNEDKNKTTKLQEIELSIENKVNNTWAKVVKDNPSSQHGHSEATPLSALQLRAATDEVQDVEKRKMNLIISGLPESLQDMKNFIDYANKECNLTQPLRKEDILSLERIGTKTTRPRLSRIKLTCALKRRALLIMRPQPQRSTLVDGSETERVDNNIYLRPDLTKTQQDADKVLRNELKEKGKDKYKIHRGVIVLREAPMPRKKSNAVNYPASAVQPSPSSDEASKNSTESTTIQQANTNGPSPFGHAADAYAASVKVGLPPATSPTIKDNELGNSLIIEPTNSAIIQVQASSAENTKTPTMTDKAQHESGPNAKSPMIRSKQGILIRKSTRTSPPNKASPLVAKRTIKTPTIKSLPKKLDDKPITNSAKKYTPPKIRSSERSKPKKQEKINSI